jgi:hypothetical protein
MRSSDRAAFRRAALLGLLALTSATLLPYVHAITGACDHAKPACHSSDRDRESAHGDGSGSTSHSRHCGVCGAFAQGKSRALVFARALPIAAPMLAFARAYFVPIVVLASGDSDVAGARAPPASHRSA